MKVTLPGTDGGPFVHSVSVLDSREVRVVFGPGTLNEVAAEARALGTSVLLISGRHEAKAADVVSAGLGADLSRRIEEVHPHVPTDVASRATAVARDVAADVVVAIGGGSAVGLAKAVALEIQLPIVAVPTTYAGSEMTPVWGRSDAGGKTTGRDPRVQPAVVVYDPLLTLSMPADPERRERPERPRSRSRGAVRTRQHPGIAWRCRTGHCDVGVRAASGGEGP